jgi:hypothetical protein
MFRCARIQGLDTSEGLILFGKEHCYVVDGFTLLKNREIRDIDSMPGGTYEPILPASGGPRIQSLRQCSKFAYEDIREVHKRRYLLQPIALEIFSGDGRNYLLSFQRKVRNKVYQRVMALATSIADNAQSSVAGQRRTASVEQTSGLLSSLIGETSVTQRWVVSNYLLLLLSKIKKKFNLFLAWRNFQLSVFDAFKYARWSFLQRFNAISSISVDFG